MVSRRAWRCQRAASTRVNQRRWSLLGVGRTQEQRCQSGCELRPRSSAQHAASSSQVRQFAFMPRPVEIARSPRWTVRGERTTRTPSRHSMGTSDYWVINLEKKKEKKNKPVARTVILVAIDFCWSWFSEWALFEWILPHCVACIVLFTYHLGVDFSESR